MADRCGPAWLPALLKGSYFGHCGTHPAANKNETNYFCTSCEGKTLCHVCVERDHSTHKHSIIQVFRSSYCDAVRISDVSKQLNLSDIQHYRINNKPIVFLNARPQAKLQKGAIFTCEACERMLIDPGRFCSLGCKLQIAPSDRTVSLAPFGGLGNLSPRNSSESEKHQMKHFRMKQKFGDGDLSPMHGTKRQRDEETVPEPPETPEIKKVHRRKGIPKASPAPGEYFSNSSFVLLNLEACFV